MNPLMMQMMMWQQGLSMLRAAMTAQTEFNIRLIEAMAGAIEPRSAEQLARDAESLRSAACRRRNNAVRAAQPQPAAKAATAARTNGAARGMGDDTAGPAVRSH